MPVRHSRRNRRLRSDAGFAGEPWPTLASRSARWLFCLVLASLPAFGAELLTGFRPSAVRSEHGAVSEVEFSTGLVELESGVLARWAEALREARGVLDAFIDRLERGGEVNP